VSTTLDCCRILEEPLPESPEVAVHVDFLRSIAVGKRLLGVVPQSGRYIKSPIPGFLTWGVKSSPGIVEEVGRKGKLVYWRLNNGVVLNSLGMTGSWRLRVLGARVAFHLIGPADSLVSIGFFDPRNFGTLRFTDTPELQRKLASLGPDLLEETAPLDFVDRLRGCRSTISEALMDQGRISGIGNYLKCDSLWVAGIHPNALVENVSDERLVALGEAAISLARESYAAKGATLSTYTQPDGSVGGYSTRVYGRKVDPDGGSVEKIRTADGRTTWFSPIRQST